MRDVCQQQVPHVVCLGETEEQRGEVRQSWTRFDSLRCRCFNPADKERIIAVIEKGDGGIAGFNLIVQQLSARARFDDSFAERHREVSAMSVGAAQAPAWPAVLKVEASGIAASSEGQRVLLIEL